MDHTARLDWQITTSNELALAHEEKNMPSTSEPLDSGIRDGRDGWVEPKEGHQVNRTISDSSRRVVDQETFRSIMGAFPAGVAIVTTADAQGQRFGLTTTAVSSVSADPPLLLICVAHTSRTLPVLQRTRRFIVHFMDDDAVGTSSLFASKSSDKFDSVAWRSSATGMPLLTEGTLAWAECETESESVVGDHVVIFARLVDGAGPSEERSRRPLVYFNRRFGNWVPAGMQ